jgi:hypothetical protein
MRNDPQLRAFDYVNQPYERVREALSTGADEIFRNATRAAASRAYDVAAALHVNIAGVEIGTEIDIDVGNIEESTGVRPWGATTRLRIEWAAAKRPRLFPVMKGELSVYPLTTTETQLDFEGSYDPPLGPLGDVIDALIGRRIAEASVHRFVTDVTDYLRRKLAS